MYYVYIIQNESHELYYGYTGDLKRRFLEHNSPNKHYTGGHKWRLVYYEAFSDKRDAMIREKKLKKYGQSLNHLKNRLRYSLSKN